MKTVRYILLLISVTSVLAAACEDKNSYSAAIKVAKSFIKAWEDQDVKKLDELLCTHEERTDEQADLVTAVKIDYYDLKYKLEDKKDNSVIVRITGMMNMGGMYVSSLDLPLLLEKQGDEWCIADEIVGEEAEP